MGCSPLRTGVLGRVDLDPLAQELWDSSTRFPVGLPLLLDLLPAAHHPVFRPARLPLRPVERESCLPGAVTRALVYEFRRTCDRQPCDLRDERKPYHIMYELCLSHRPKFRKASTTCRGVAPVPRGNPIRRWFGKPFVRPSCRTLSTPQIPYFECSHSHVRRAGRTGPLETSTIPSVHRDHDLRRFQCLARPLRCPRWEPRACVTSPFRTCLGPSRPAHHHGLRHGRDSHAPAEASRPGACPRVCGKSGVQSQQPADLGYSSALSFGPVPVPRTGQQDRELHGLPELRDHAGARRGHGIHLWSRLQASWI